MKRVCVQVEGSGGEVEFLDQGLMRPWHLDEPLSGAEVGSVGEVWIGGCGGWWG